MLCFKASQVYILFFGRAKELSHIILCVCVFFSHWIKKKQNSGKRTENLPHKSAQENFADVCEQDK